MPPRFGAASILTAIAGAVGGANRGESSMTRLERSIIGRALARRERKEERRPPQHFNLADEIFGSDVSAGRADHARRADFGARARTIS